MRGLLGVAESFYIPASVALIADHHPTRTRATAMAFHLTGFYAAVISEERDGLFGRELRLARLALRAWSPRFGFGRGLPDGFARPPTGCDYAIRPYGVDWKAFLWRSSFPLIQTPSYLVLLAAETLLAIGVWIFANWLPLYFNETFRQSLSHAAFSGTFPTQAGADPRLRIVLTSGPILVINTAGRQSRTLCLTRGNGVSVALIKFFIINTLERR